jgi:hypothetical protein
MMHVRRRKRPPAPMKFTLSVWAGIILAALGMAMLVEMG